MAEETTATQTQETQEQQTTTVAATEFNPFEDSSWSESPQALVATETTTTEPKPTEEKKEEEPKVEAKKEEVSDADTFVKQHFGYDSIDAVKKEWEELKKLKEQATTTTEIKFANEQSEKFFNALKDGKEEDVYQYLHHKQEMKRIESLNPEIPKDATELIKSIWKYKYKTLSDSEIHEQFDEAYQRPDKPDKDLHTDEEYQDLLQKWEARNQAIDRKIIRDAKMLRPELPQLNTEIVLPDIKKESEVKKELSQEELDAFNKLKDSFVQSVDSGVKDFKGFSVTVKDKDVDYAVSYGVSDEEKTAVVNQLKDFAEKGFNANNLFIQRWVNKDGSVNHQQMTEDLLLLQGKEKIFQKIANDAANQRLEMYLKEKKKIDVNGQSQQGTFSPDNKTETEKMADFFWSQS